MKRPKKPQAVSIAPGQVAAPGAITELLQYREDSLTAQLGGAMARAMKGAGPSGIYSYKSFYAFNQFMFCAFMNCHHTRQ
jgi:hypothetical protein